MSLVKLNENYEPNTAKRDNDNGLFDRSHVQAF